MRLILFVTDIPLVNIQYNKFEILNVKKITLSGENTWTDFMTQRKNDSFVATKLELDLISRENYKHNIMKIKLIVVGKTDLGYIADAIGGYEKRLKHYISFEIQTIPDIKNAKSLTEHVLKEKEGEQILNLLTKTDEVILLDERGKQYTSLEFANFISTKLLASVKNLVFVVGGAYGFSQQVYDRALGKIALSSMTFTHQMIRLFFIEQLYRAFSIIKGESYHH